MTPGGTTERGIWHFGKANITQTFIDALNKSSMRSTELGTQTSAATNNGDTQC